GLRGEAPPHGRGVPEEPLPVVQEELVRLGVLVPEGPELRAGGNGPPGDAPVGQDEIDVAVVLDVEEARAPARVRESGSPEARRSRAVHVRAALGAEIESG